MEYPFTKAQKNLVSLNLSFLTPDAPPNALAIGNSTPINEWRRNAPPLVYWCLYSSAFPLSPHPALSKVTLLGSSLGTFRLARADRGSTRKTSAIVVIPDSTLAIAAWRKDWKSLLWR